MSTMFRKGKTWISSAHQGFVADGVHSNTLKAYYLAAQKGADMIETDARTTRDGVIVANHDPEVRGFDEQGNAVTYTISQTDHSVIAGVRLGDGEPCGNRVPTLEQTLQLAYFTGMCVNIDLKEGALHARDIAELVVKNGMRGRVVYATNGSGADTMKCILSIDPDARFIDTKWNYTRKALAEIPEYQSKCYVYTGDFSDENIAEIRKSGCMLAAISLCEANAAEAFRHHPDMAEYPHFSDFEKIDRDIISAYCTELIK